MNQIAYARLRLYLRVLLSAWIATPLTTNVLAQSDSGTATAGASLARTLANAAPLTDTDTIVLADVDNNTGETDRKSVV